MTGAEAAIIAAAAPEVIGATAAGTAAAGTAAAAAPVLGGTMAASALPAGMTGAAMFGPSALGASATPLATGLLAGAEGAAATPFFTEAATLAGQGVPMGMDIAMGSPSWTAAAPKAGMSSTFANMLTKQGANMLGQQPQGGGGGGRGPTSFGSPMSREEIMQRLKMMQSHRSDWAGLLGRAM